MKYSLDKHIIEKEILFACAESLALSKGNIESLPLEYRDFIILKPDGNYTFDFSLIRSFVNGLLKHYKVNKRTLFILTDNNWDVLPIKLDSDAEKAAFHTKIEYCFKKRLQEPLNLKVHRDLNYQFWESPLDFLKHIIMLETAQDVENVVSDYFEDQAFDLGFTEEMIYGAA